MATTQENRARRAGSRRSPGDDHGCTHWDLTNVFHCQPVERAGRDDRTLPFTSQLSSKWSSPGKTAGLTVLRGTLCTKEWNGRCGRALVARSIAPHRPFAGKEEAPRANQLIDILEPTQLRLSALVHSAQSADANREKPGAKPGFLWTVSLLLETGRRHVGGGRGYFFFAPPPGGPRWIWSVSNVGGYKPEGLRWKEKDDQRPGVRGVAAGVDRRA